MTKDTHIPQFMEEAMKSFKQFSVPITDMETLMTMYKKNIELMNSTQQIAIEATKEMMDLQRSYMQKALDQWNEQIKETTTKGPLEEKATDQTKSTQDAVSQTIDHIQELNSIIAKSSEKINETFQKRFKETLGESLDAAKKEQDKNKK